MHHDPEVATETIPELVRVADVYTAGIVPMVRAFSGCDVMPLERIEEPFAQRAGYRCVTSGTRLRMWCCGQS